MVAERIRRKAEERSQLWAQRVEAARALLLAGQPGQATNMSKWQAPAPHASHRAAAGSDGSAVASVGDSDSVPRCVCRYLRCGRSCCRFPSSRARACLWFGVHASRSRVRVVVEAPTMVCGACLIGEATEDDCILICDGCGVGVHLSCYDLESVPPGDWCVVVGRTLSFRRPRPPPLHGS